MRYLDFSKLRVRNGSFSLTISQFTHSFFQNVISFFIFGVVLWRWWMLKTGSQIHWKDSGYQIHGQSWFKVTNHKFWYSFLLSFIWNNSKWELLWYSILLISSYRVVLTQWNCRVFLNNNVFWTLFFTADRHSLKDEIETHFVWIWFGLSMHGQDCVNSLA